MPLHDRTSLPPAVTAMLDASFYPHPITDPIQIVETHISYVLLAGEFAYKLKKAVNLGFLDFSTLERRRHFCHEEVRLNQRGAPGLYLGVDSINRTGANGRLTLGGSGEAVEYAVRMRRFPPGSLLSERLHQGSVDEPEVRRLAATVAEYHGAAPTDDAIAGFGHPDRVGASIDENYRQTERSIGVLQPREQFEKTKEFTDQFLARYASTFLLRAGSGKVRECHGDLHLNNICLWDKRFLLFDCIEFNDAFRCVDVMYDVAFAVMDFEARGRPDFAAVFRNGYAEVTGDWDGLQVLPLFLCRHAYVRAKVNSLLAADDRAGEAVRGRAAADAKRYYRLAYRYTRPRRGRLILMCGLSGSGKSSVARALSARTGAAHIRSDAVRKHLAGLDLTVRGPAEIYTAEWTQRTYHRLLELGLTLAAQGEAVLLDAKYDRAEFRTAAFAAAKAAGVPADVLVCEAPADVLRERLRARAGDIADATHEIVDVQLAQWEPIRGDEATRAITLDATRPPQQIALDVCRHLQLEQLS